MADFACRFPISLLSLQRHRIGGNVRTTAERNGNGRHDFCAPLIDCLLRVGWSGAFLLDRLNVLVRIMPILESLCIRQYVTTKCTKVMIHFYCFIEDPCNLLAGSRVFKVKVGDDQRDQVKRVLVDCYATDTNAFFRLWDADTDYYLANQLRTKPRDPAGRNSGLCVIVTDIRTLYRNILDGTLDSISNPPCVARNLFRMMSILSTSFFMRNHSARRVPSVPPVKRQNLSVRPTREDSMAAIGFALMALLYWLGSLVGCLEKVWL